MSDTNKAFITGRLVREPESRRTNGGTALATFCVATGEKWRDKASNEMKEETTFLDCEVWGGSADFVTNYLHKGSRVLIEGKIAQDRWEDPNTGQKRSKLKIKVLSVQGLDGKPADGGNQRQPQQQPQRQQQPQQGYGQPQQGYGQPQDNRTDDAEDDLPF